MTRLDRVVVPAGQPRGVDPVRVERILAAIPAGRLRDRVLFTLIATNRTTRLRGTRRLRRGSRTRPGQRALHRHRHRRPPTAPSCSTTRRCSPCSAATCGPAGGAQLTEFTATGRLASTAEAQAKGGGRLGSPWVSSTGAGRGCGAPGAACRPRSGRGPSQRRGVRACCELVGPTDRGRQARHRADHQVVAADGDVPVPGRRREPRRHRPVRPVHRIRPQRLLQRPPAVERADPEAGEELQPVPTAPARRPPTSRSPAPTRGQLPQPPVHHGRRPRQTAVIVEAKVVVAQHGHPLRDRWRRRHVPRLPVRTGKEGQIHDR